MFISNDDEIVIITSNITMLSMIVGITNSDYIITDTKARRPNSDSANLI